APIPRALKTSRGPTAGHSWRSPVSGDWPSRLVPRHPGQSDANAPAGQAAMAAANATSTMRRIDRDRFITWLLSSLEGMVARPRRASSGHRLEGPPPQRFTPPIGQERWRCYRGSSNDPGGRYARDDDGDDGGGGPG